MRLHLLMILLLADRYLSQEIGCYIQGECAESFAVGVADVEHDVDCHR